MKMKNILSILLLSLLVVTARSERLEFEPIGSGIQLEAIYFSILSPKGDQWYWNNTYRKGFNVMIFTKEGKSKTLTYVAQVTEFYDTDRSFSSPKAFLDHYSKKVAEGKRYKILSEESHLDNRFGKYCIRYYIETEDHGAANKEGEEPLIMRIYGYRFFHPIKKNVLIDIAYSERGKPQELDRFFKKTADVFFEGFSVKTEKLPKFLR
jgi:hypothetical protein